MTRQLALDLPLRTALGRADFFVAPSNAVALAAVEGWRGWPGGRMLITGAAGAGKTHLAQVWRGLVPQGAAVVAGAALAGADVPGLAAAGAVLVEDAEGVAGPGEAALFHLHNMLGEAGGHLLLTARTGVAGWGLTLPDLASRMQAIPVVRIDPPCDALLSAVLVKLFADRQVAVPPAVIAHLAARMERSLSTAADLVARADALALARGGAVTLAVARLALAEG
ncbi:MAG: chromosomal replication initiator DnaA [Paracoccaceae bacterium]|nr:MAG: chromosomal replication initiator DnaA [Paracoccaceae bacterium]